MLNVRGGAFQKRRYLETSLLDVKPGKMSDALEWAERAWKAVEASGSLGPKLWLLRTIASDTNRFSFVTRCNSMGEWEELAKKRLTDPKIKALQEMGNAGWCVIYEKPLLCSDVCTKAGSKCTVFDVPYSN